LSSPCSLLVPLPPLLTPFPYTTLFRSRFPPLMVGSTAALVAASLLFVVAAAPLYQLGQRAAEFLFEPAQYVEAVLGPCDVSPPASSGSPPCGSPPGPTGRGPTCCPGP